MNPFSKMLAARRSVEEQAKQFAESFEREIEAVRRRIELTSEQIHDARTAPVDTEVLKERITASVDDVLNNSRNVRAFLSGVSLPHKRFVEDTVSFDSNSVDSIVGELSAFELAAILDRDGLIDGLLRESVGAGNSGPKALSDAERTATLARLEAEMRQMEASEEIMLRGLEKAGGAPVRRRDADIEIICADDDSLHRLAEAMP